MTIETFSIVIGAACGGSGWSSSSVIVCSFLDAAAGLGDAADPGCELGRSLGEELVELFDRDAGLLAEGTDRGCGAGREVTVAHEVDDQPVARGQFRDSAVARDRGCDLLVPVVGVCQEPFGVDLDGSVCDQRCRHLLLLVSLCGRDPF